MESFFDWVEIMYVCHNANNKQKTWKPQNFNIYKKVIYFIPALFLLSSFKE